jgi:hypothetical protein
MVAFVTYDDKHVVVLDVETRKIVKIYNNKDFKLEDFANDLLIPQVQYDTTGTSRQGHLPAPVLLQSK